MISACLPAKYKRDDPRGAETWTRSHAEDMTIWARPPELSGREISRAGLVLIGQQDGDYDAAVNIINSWRAAHAFPLNAFQVTLRDRVRRHLDAGLVTQRLKRLEALRIKLSRFYPRMRLSHVQDIGGCRAIVRDVSDVYALKTLYAPDSMNHEWRREKDYISEPKEDGYRAIHLAYRYVPTRDNQEPWRGLEVEIQLRTVLQHVWATAVETVDFFAKQKIKIGIREGEWSRFFMLLGNSIAERERVQLVKGLPVGRHLETELRDIALTLRVASNFQAWSKARHVLRSVDMGRSRFFLIQLNTYTMDVTVQGFTIQQQKLMEGEYAKLEREIQGHPERQAVLVGANSVAALRRGYASFFVRPKMFLDVLHNAIGSSTFRRR